MDVRLPNLGEGADSGVVVAVSVKEGDTIQKGQTLIELESGKAVAPIPSPSSGKVTSIKVKEGDKISTGTVILSLEGAAGSGASAPPPAAEKKTPRPTPPAVVAAPEPELESSSDGEDVDSEPEETDEQTAAMAASPELRRMARMLGIPLTRIKGSARGGRVTFEDVKAWIGRLRRAAAQARVVASPAVVSRPAAPKVDRVDFAQFGVVSRKPLSALRKVIAQRMLESTSLIPQVTQFDEADITRLLDLRKRHLAAYESKGARLTVTGIVLKAVVGTLLKHPLFNASIDEVTSEIVFKEYVHLGIAVDTEAGLIVPVIRDAHKKSVLELSLDLQNLAEKARDRKVSLDELKGGSFTISNQGGIGGGHFTPIVNRPESAILGMGKGSVKAIVKEKQIVPRTLLPLALSYDHRLIDGGSAARFISDLATAIEQFEESELKL
ncbi:MAG: biotin/lipoyl-binding protein [Verrucomicrobia bacterium]|nr:biotin/lipoyl-binding protein [Verrucomicrobiota bacterium]